MLTHCSSSSLKENIIGRGEICDSAFAPLLVFNSPQLHESSFEYTVLNFSSYCGTKCYLELLKYIDMSGICSGHKI